MSPTVLDEPFSNEPAEHDDRVELPAAPHVSRRRLVAGAIGVVALLSGLFVTGWLPRRACAAAAVAASEERAQGPRRTEVEARPSWQQQPNTHFVV